jgi:uncharacterized membrane protein
VVQVNRHRASVAMPIGVEELYAWVREVRHWPQFLDGLVSVEPLGFRRYRWTVTYAGRSRTCDVVASMDPHEHRIAWRRQHRPAFDGTIRLTPVGDARTRVDLMIQIEPAGFLDGFVDSTGMTGWMAEHDLQRLRRLVLDGALQNPAPSPGELTG